MSKKNQKMSTPCPKILVITPSAPWDVKLDELFEGIKKSGFEVLRHWTLGPDGLDNAPENDVWKKQFSADIDAADAILRTQADLCDSWLMYDTVPYFLNYIKEKNKPEVVFSADWDTDANPAFDFIYFNDDVDRVMQEVREKLAAQTTNQS